MIRSGTFGNISSLVSVTERVKQLNSAMSSRQVRTRNHNAPAFFTAKDMIKAETHAENVTLETFGDHAGKRTDPLLSAHFSYGLIFMQALKASFLSLVRQPTSTTKKVFCLSLSQIGYPVKLAHLLLEICSHFFKVENEKVAFPASEYNLIIPCADSLALVHLRKSGLMS